MHQSNFYQPSVPSKNNILDRPSSMPSAAMANSGLFTANAGGSRPQLSQLTIDTPHLDTENTSTSQVSPGLATRAFGPCAECGMKIINLNDACHAMGYLYHNSCFVCCYCQRTLCGKMFYKDQDKIYCEEDYLYCGFQQTAEKCSVCGHLISESILQALGNSYHPGCFTCTICTKCLDGVPFAVDAQNLIYCLADYHLAFGPLCAACGMVIVPEKGSSDVLRIVAMDKEFHIDCYRCRDCKRPLSDDLESRCSPMTETDSLSSEKKYQRLLCLNCHLSRIGAVPATTANNSPRPTGSSYSPHVRFFPLSSKYPGHIGKSPG